MSDHDRDARARATRLVEHAVRGESTPPPGDSRAALPTITVEFIVAESALKTRIRLHRALWFVVVVAAGAPTLGLLALMFVARAAMAASGPEADLGTVLARVSASILTIGVWAAIVVPVFFRWQHAPDVTAAAAIRAGQLEWLPAFVAAEFERLRAKAYRSAPWASRAASSAVAVSPSAALDGGMAAASLQQPAPPSHPQRQEESLARTSRRLRRKQDRAERALNKQDRAVCLPAYITPTEAEHLCAEWMKRLGARGVRVTQATGDGGVDVVSRGWIAQVKHYRGTVGVAPIRELVGVAAVDGRRPAFFTAGRYAQGAVDFADKAGVALFHYDHVTGVLTGVNSSGRKAARWGLESPRQRPGST